MILEHVDNIWYTWIKMNGLSPYPSLHWISSPRNKFNLSNSEFQASCSLILKYIPETAWNSESVYAVDWIQCVCLTQNACYIYSSGLHRENMFLCSLFHGRELPQNIYISQLFFHNCEDNNRALEKMKAGYSSLKHETEKMKICWDKTLWNLYSKSQAPVQFVTKHYFFFEPVFHIMHIHHFLHITSIVSKKFHASCYQKQKSR